MTVSVGDPARAEQLRRHNTIESAAVKADLSKREPLTQFDIDRLNELLLHNGKVCTDGHMHFGGVLCPQCRCMTIRERYEAAAHSRGMFVGGQSIPGDRPSYMRVMR